MFIDRYANFDLTTGANDGTSEADAWQTPADVIAGVASGNKVWIKKQASPYPLTVPVAFPVAGTALNPIYYCGYETTPGDGGMWEVEPDGWIKDLEFSGAFNYVEGISCIAGAGLYNHFNVSGEGSWAVRCNMLAVGGSKLDITNAYLCAFDIYDASYIKGSGGGSANSSCIFKQCILNKHTDNTVDLLTLDTYGENIDISQCIFNGKPSANGVYVYRTDNSRGGLVENNLFYNWLNGVFVEDQPDASTETLVFSRNIFSITAEYAIKYNNTLTGFVSILDNFYHNCVSGFTNYEEEQAWRPNTELSESPFTDEAEGDFTINNEAAGGAVLRSKGLPVYPAYDWDTMQFQPVYEGTGGRRPRAKYLGGVM